MEQNNTLGNKMDDVIVKIKTFVEQLTYVQGLYIFFATIALLVVLFFGKSLYLRLECEYLGRNGDRIVAETLGKGDMEGFFKLAAKANECRRIL